MHILRTIKLSILGLCFAQLLAACTQTAQAPVRLGLRLAPNALGASISVLQHLIIEHAGRVIDLDVALEVDEREINLVGLVLGRRVLTLRYDGANLEVWRDPMVPEQLRGEDILEDLQLTLWPIESIREDLPKGWSINENDASRFLFWEGSLVTLITYSGKPHWSGEVVLRNVRYNYKL